MVAFAPTSTTQGIWQLEQIYIGYYGRAVDASGYNYWQAEYNARIGGTYKIGGVTQARQSSADAIASIASSFGAATQAETVALYPFLGSSVTFPTSDTIVKTQIASFVTSVYQNLFNRAPDLTGLTYWTDQIAAGRVSTSVAILAIGNAAGDDNSTQSLADAKVLNNKIAVSDNFLVSTSTNGIGVSGTVPASVLAQAKAILVGVDGTAASVSTAATAQTNWVATGAGTPGTIFNLTTGADNYIGTSAAESVTGVIDFGGGTTAGALSTLNSSDTINMAGGSDTLSVIMRNASGAAIGTGTTATAQVLTVSVPVPAGATNTITVNYGGLSTTVVTGATSSTAGNAIAAAINQSAGQAIAVFTAGADPAVNPGSIVITAPTAGTALPAITYAASAAASQPTVTFTTANAAAAGSAVSIGSVSGVETLSVQNVSGSAVTLSAAQAPGHTTFVNDRSTSAMTVTNLANGAAVTIQGDGSATAQGALTATYASTATTAGALSINGGATTGAVSFTSPTVVTSNTINSTGGAQASTGGQVNTFGGLTLGANVQTLNINAATSLTTGTITAAALTNIIASGAGTTVNISTAPATVTSIDGSGLTAGGVTATLTAAVTSFKGGAGVDTVTTATTTAAGAVIDGGAGAGDILSLVAGNDITTSAKAAQYVNFEVLRNSVTAAAVDASLFTGITSVQIGTTGGATNGAGFTNLTATQANAVTIRSGSDTGATFALANSAGTSDVLRVTLNNATSGTGSVTAVVFTGATVNGFETMNLVSSSGTNGSVSTLGFTGATDLTALNISGVAPLSMTTANIAKAVTIDASAMSFVPTSGNFTFAITAGNLIKGSIVTATGAADSIVTTAAVAGTTGDFVTYNLGGGNDAISSTIAAINNTSAANASLKIDGGAGTDTLTITDNGLTAVDANFQYITNIETISYTVTNTAISVTSGGFFDTNFKTAGVTLTLGDATNAQVNTVNLSTFTGAATVSLTATAASTQVQTISTGAGNDTVTLINTGLTTAASVVSTGGGNDTINVTISGTTATTGSVTINGGSGQDTITITGNSTVNLDTASNIIIRVNEGHSTLTAFDTVGGWVLNAAAKIVDSLDFDGTAAVAADVASSASGLTNVNYAIATGLMTFSGTAATGLTVAQKAAIAQTFVVAADATVAFTDGADSYVFHNGVVTDDLVRITSVTVLGLGLNSTPVTTTGFIDIA